MLGVAITTVSCGDHHTDSVVMFVVIDHGSNVMGINLFEAMNFAINMPSSLLQSHASIVIPVEQTKVQQQNSIRFKQIFNDSFGQVHEIVYF